jgi:hypothetical protein
VGLTSHSGWDARDGARRAVPRWLVHLGLIVTVIVSLVFEPLALTIHIAVGLVAGHPTRTRWHVITGVVLAVLLLIHTVRRWSRLRRSKVR